MPRLADYLTLEEVEKNFQRRKIRLPDRIYDEKFHILQAPTLLISDINYYREVCAARGANLAVAYLDIDDFKNLNTKYGHHAVDTDVLPVFMRALEGFTFSRGQAYRFGGDEYAILLGNGQRAAEALQDLQQALLRLTYRNINEKTTVSIGLCLITSDCFLSDQEVIERANRAVRHAKEQGKNSIATYEGELYRDQDLRMLAPAASLP
jgi:diguanylate cyclase (GGDEF)-like protein